MTTTTAPRANKFGAKCARCRGWVEAEAGILGGSRATGWTTTHAGECPAPTPRPANAEPGYYVRADGRAVKVEQSKRHADRTYGKILTFHGEGARPSWEYQPGVGYSVADLRPMTAEVAAGLGLSCGYCVFCLRPLGGDSLGAAISALIGYGETCAGHHALPYPKGVAAQRAYLAEHGS